VSTTNSGCFCILMLGRAWGSTADSRQAAGWDYVSGRYNQWTKTIN